MDPNETLAEILANVRILLDEPSETPTAAQAAVADLLAERVRDLDEWIRKGGFLPSAWARESERMRFDVEPSPGRAREAQVRCGRRILGVFPYTVGDPPEAAFDRAETHARALAHGVELAGGRCTVYRGPYLAASVWNE